MENKTVFIKRYPSKGEFPKEDVFAVLTNNGKVFRFDVTDRTEWWLEEIELPSEDYLQDIAIKTTPFRTSFMAGSTFILNHLKSKTNG